MTIIELFIVLGIFFGLILGIVVGCLVFGLSWWIFVTAICGVILGYCLGIGAAYLLMWGL